MRVQLGFVVCFGFKKYKKNNNKKKGHNRVDYDPNPITPNSNPVFILSCSCQIHGSCQKLQSLPYSLSDRCGEKGDSHSHSFIFLRYINYSI
jgi:hypothetical protein